MLSNAYFLAKIRFDTAENEPAKICKIFEKCIFEKCIFENAFSENSIGDLAYQRVDSRRATGSPALTATTWEAASSASESAPAASGRTYGGAVG